ncbi:hypothetical protein EYC84_009841 [Monilinia fructicola]|uniref:Uncharacterized protein n=1 Tax=Monilinia fructicola TaxID=38448 RepID=A0A5M9JDZ1_MONFR|nr:hypothetical protein EYC84_009841 [Monilinia fructicola]
MCNLMRHACIPIFAWRIQHIEVYSSDSDDGLLGPFAFLHCLAFDLIYRYLTSSDHLDFSFRIHPRE